MTRLQLSAMFSTFIKWGEISSTYNLMDEKSSHLSLLGIEIIESVSRETERKRHSRQ